MDIAILAIALLAILLGAELFTNGVEWAGHKLGLAEGAVGSVLAAVGTALPETMIPLIAIVVTGTEGANEVGVGAILGAPFMLSTLAMFVTGVAVLVTRRGQPGDTPMPVDVKRHRPRHALVRGRLRHRARGRVRPERPGLAALGRRGGAAHHVRAVRSPAPPGRGDPQRSERPRAAPPPSARPEGAAAGRPAAAPDRRRPGRDRPRLHHRRGVRVRRRRRGPGPLLRPRRGAAGPDHRPHRDGAAGEVQQRDLGAPDEGHPGDGQPDRGDGVPGHHPDGHRPPVRQRALGDRQRDVPRLRLGPHRLSPPRR